MRNLSKLIDDFNQIVDNDYNIFEKEHDIIKECIQIQQLCMKQYSFLPNINYPKIQYKDLDFCDYNPTFVMILQVTLTAFDIDIDLYSNQTGMIKINSNRILFKDRTKPSHGVHRILLRKDMISYYFKINNTVETVELSQLNELYDCNLPKNYSDWGIEEYCLLKMIEE